MGHLHIHLAHAASLDPRTARLRRREDRTARGVRPSRKNELWYRAQLFAIVKELRAAGVALADGVRRAFETRIVPTHDSALALDAAIAALPVEIQVEIDKFARKFGGIELVARRLTDIRNRLGLVRRNLAEVDSRLAASIQRSVGIDISGTFATGEGRIGAAMEAAARANVALITSIPEQHLEEVKNLVSEAWVRGDRWEVLAKEIADHSDVTDARARLIARDQTSKMNAAFNEIRQTDVGIQRYTWHGALDQRERPSHIRMEGSVQRWDSPPDVDGENVHPGQAILCRCSALPVFNLDTVEQEAEAA